MRSRAWAHVTDRESFTSKWARAVMAGVASLPAVAVCVGYWAATGVAAWMPVAAAVATAAVVALFWRRHARVEFSVDSIVVYNWGRRQKVAYRTIDGYVWQAGWLLGDGIVLVAIDETNGIGLRWLCPTMTASCLLSRSSEELLLDEIRQRVPDIRHFATPRPWQRQGFMTLPSRTGGADPAQPGHPPASG